MKRATNWGLCVAVGLGIATASAVLCTSDESAAKGKPAATATAAVDPPNVKNKDGVKLTPDGIRWGMSPDEVADFYDKVIDDDYLPRYKKAQAGPETNTLDAEVANLKAALRRSRVEFGNLPTGVDSTPLKGEYTYRNQESLMSVTRSNAPTRYFFFMRGKLWKMYDEVRLEAKGPLGESFADAVAKYKDTFQVDGRTTQPDYSANRSYAEVDWQDSKTHLRLIDRSGTKVIGVVFEDRGMLAMLSSYRTNKAVDQDAVDPSIQALVRPEGPQAGPPDADKNKGKGKNKGGKRK